jgi:NTP pyrophosphatase (non-canonical NTP hydrolase)
MGDQPQTVSGLLEKVLEFRDARSWKQFHKPKDLALALSAEVGELAELFLWQKDDELKPPHLDPGLRRRFSEEIADVQIFLLLLVDALDLDLPAAVCAKLQENAGKYPVEKAYGSPKKYTDLG